MYNRIHLPDTAIIPFQNNGAECELMNRKLCIAYRTHVHNELRKTFGYIDVCSFDGIDYFISDDCREIIEHTLETIHQQFISGGLQL